MSNADPGDHARLLTDEIEALRENVDFADRSTDGTLHTVAYLVRVAELLNLQMIERYGGDATVPPIMGALDAAIAAAFQSYGDEELYPTEFMKAAALWRGITNGHVFGDGNKRTGFMLAIYYLEARGYVIDYPSIPLPELLEAGARVATGTITDVQAISTYFHIWWEQSEWPGRDPF